MEINSLRTTGFSPSDIGLARIMLNQADEIKQLKQEVEELKKQSTISQRDATSYAAFSAQHQRLAKQGQSGKELSDDEEIKSEVPWWNPV